MRTGLWRTRSGHAARPAMAWLGALALVALLSACSWLPWTDEAVPPTRINAVIAASSRANPDASGRPSPLVVWVYELRAVPAFRNAGFFALADDGADVLGADLLRRREVELSPGEATRLEFEPREDTRYLGVVAAYRDINEAGWRAAVPVPAHRTSRLAITLERLGVTISRVEPDASGMR